MGTCTCKKDRVVSPARQVALPTVDRNNDSVSSHFSFVVRENIQKYYRLKEIVGSGYFGDVRKSVRADGSTTEPVAIKSIAKEKVRKKGLLKRELETLKQMDHPNIIRLFEVYEDERYIHLVMELCRGGELFEQISQKHKFTEREAALLIYKLLHAINYMHSQQISHRDIKAENILYSSASADSDIKLIDFGLANKFAEGTEMHSMVGTPYYVAPEVLAKQYGPECDIWSIGVLVFYMLSGSPPFDGESRKAIYYKILNADYSFADPLWEAVSDDAKQLIRSMLCISRTDRITARQAMEHSWFQQQLDKPETMKRDQKVLRRLSRRCKGKGFRDDILYVISRHLNTEELKHLNQVFRSIDADHSGRISYDEFEAAVQTVNSTQDLKTTFACLSTDGNIEYSEFLTAAMDRRILHDKEVRWITFKFFDSDDKGYITVASVKTALERLGVHSTAAEVEEKLTEVGLKYDKWIDFEEFCQVLEPLPDELSSVSGGSNVSEFDQVYLP